MRELIRPTLFMVARLGLFLAVMAWVMVRWWVIQICIPPVDYFAAINVHGLVITDPWPSPLSGGPGSFPFTTNSWSSLEDELTSFDLDDSATHTGAEDFIDGLSFGGPAAVDLDPKVDYTLEPIPGWVELTPRHSLFDYYQDVEFVSVFPGVAQSPSSNGWAFPVAIRHWLIVISFFASNVILHIICRKRSEVLQCES